MCLSDRGELGKEEVDLDNLAVAGGAEAHSVIADSQLRGDGIELFPDFSPSAGVRVV